MRCPFCTETIKDESVVCKNCARDLRIVRPVVAEIEAIAVELDALHDDFIGVGEKQGAVIGQSRDNWVIIPITVYQKMFGGRRNVRIYAKAGGESFVESASAQHP